VLFDHLPNALPQVREGKVKGLCGDRPTPARPPRLISRRWMKPAIRAFTLISGTASGSRRAHRQRVKARLNAAVMDALADPKVRQQLSELGQVIPPRDQQTPEALAAYQKAEIDKWWPIVKAANMKVE